MRWIVACAMRCAWYVNRGVAERRRGDGKVVFGGFEKITIDSKLRNDRLPSHLPTLPINNNNMRPHRMLT
jgi:hypothetical protein